MTPTIILRCRGNVFTELLPSNDRGYTDRPTDKLSTILLLLGVLFVAGMCLPSRCLATIGDTQTDLRTSSQQFFYC
jgi:hypothetical protein